MEIKVRPKRKPVFKAWRWQKSDEKAILKGETPHHWPGWLKCTTDFIRGAKVCNILWADIYKEDVNIFERVVVICSNKGENRLNVGDLVIKLPEEIVHCDKKEIKRKFEEVK